MATNLKVISCSMAWKNKNYVLRKKKDKREWQSVIFCHLAAQIKSVLSMKLMDGVKKLLNWKLQLVLITNWTKSLSCWS